MSFFGSSFNYKVLENYSLTNLKDKDKFVTLMVQNLLENVFQDISDNLIGLDARILNSLYGNKASVNQYNGLVDLIVVNYLNQSKTVYTVEISNNSLIYQENTSPNPDVTKSFVIDFSSNAEAGLLNHLYGVIYNLFVHAEVATKLANSVNVKINNLRENKAGNQKFIEEQLETLGKTLQKAGGIGYMDAGDGLEIVAINGNQYSEMLAMIYSQICHITRLPLSYVSGTTTGSLNTSGEGDRLRLDKALRGYFVAYYKPILQEIASIIGVSKDINMQSDNLAKFEALAPFLLTLEQTELLTLEQKQKLVEEALGTAAPNTGNPT